MPTVKAYYDGTTLFPIEALYLPKGKVVNLTIADEGKAGPEIAQKLAQLECIENNLERLNKTEPIPPEFDEILAHRMNFARGLDF
ncbi:hypothetical protein FACS189473_5410 [Spirochaetia bacterium]|nr:hypothetical protein FACS189473_5410 [Spirochaetia bacterium]